MNANSNPDAKSAKTMACAAVLFSVAAFLLSGMVFVSHFFGDDAPAAPSPAPSVGAGAAAVQPPPAPPAPASAPTHTPAYAPVGRSPLAQPGETIVKPIPLQSPQQTAAAQPAPPPAGQAVPWGQAARYVGQTITIEGKVVATHNTGSVCFLNFTTEPRGGDKFYLIIFKDNFGDWPQPPEEYFLNKTVRATGRIDLHQGRPQLKINKKQQITIVE